MALPAYRLPPEIEIGANGGPQLRFDVQKSVSGQELFSQVCIVDPNIGVHATIASVIDGNTITIDGLQIALLWDGYFDGGCGRMANGGVFTIRRQLGSILTIVPRDGVTFAVGVGLVLYPGDDKSIDTCRAKFNNGRGG